ncbi:hypothetical protein [Burkholderia alba]|uniref:hypothetical protein n=1 Tax=Burkholderia alba TaxID=2683677 RepID=UPI002B05AB21|nr:hypothetical protein [Burkholderia alba]
MLFQSFAARLRNGTHLACHRIAGSSAASLAHAAGAWRGGALPDASVLGRPAGCAILAAMAGAVALVALLSVSSSRIGLNQVLRVSGWFS